MSGVIDAGRVFLAADSLGAAQSMLDRALEYSKARVQFNRAIGFFQAVKHTFADPATLWSPVEHWFGTRHMRKMHSPRKHGLWPCRRKPMWARSSERSHA
ncbi:acyl-CoA dehydrogenase family protein [Bradyrhizobium sp.]|uniref:acyl-CoA dehydrogenase family protein n=1 Tax=Bradyrhizobium sp. TaxID=376 RepID=UPI0025C65E85|nr:acyl-CoA dehydrogenase family protein [Bradyrhizobium sp.]